MTPLARLISLLWAACALSACIDYELRAECHKYAPLSLAQFLKEADVQLVPRQNGGALTSAQCPTLTDELTVTINGQPGQFWRAGGKTYHPARGGFQPSPETCFCETADFSTQAPVASELEISVTQGDARVLAHYDDVVSTLRRVPAPTPTDAPADAVAFWLETSQKLSRFELERVQLSVEQWNVNQGLYLSCPLEIRLGGLVVVTPCSQAGEPGHLWKPELRLVIPAFERTRQATYCEGAVCQPLIVKVAALDESFEL